MLATVRRVAGVVVTTLLVALLLGIAALFWLVRQEGWLIQTVATGSMEPTIPTGSVIVSRPVDPGDVRLGDVLVFRSPSGALVSGGDDGVFQATEAMLITHRVVGVEPDGDEVAFRTRGDGIAEADPWLVTPDLVRARYVAHVPAIGSVLAEPGFRRGAYLAMAAAGLVVGVAAARTLVRELRAAHAGAATDDAEAAERTPTAP